MTLKIVSYPNIGLLTKTNVVTAINDDIILLLKKMAAAMYANAGIGLAGNQIGTQHRICVIDVSAEKNALLQLINPTIIFSDGEVSSTEGCLSFSGINVTVMRPKQIIVQAIDTNGDSITIEASDLLATCLSHEIDHLDGKTFLDKLGKTSKKLALAKLNKNKKNKLTNAIETI